ncbi:MAG: hypothetical protein FWF24_04190 [Alphaproteobacteria bacterium]|nr:hypothetical protein [Alphaproteobacteria bacterium]
MNKITRSVIAATALSFGTAFLTSCSDNKEEVIKKDFIKCAKESANINIALIVERFSGEGMCVREGSLDDSTVRFFCFDDLSTFKLFRNHGGYFNNNRSLLPPKSFDQATAIEQEKIKVLERCATRTGFPLWPQQPAQLKPQ